MRNGTTALLIIIAVVSMALVVGCGKSKKPPVSPPPLPADVAHGFGPGPSGPPGSYGTPAPQPSVQQPKPPEEAAPAGPTYRERYAQGELTPEERRDERALQEIEKQLGYPVGP